MTSRSTPRRSVVTLRRGSKLTGRGWTLLITGAVLVGVAFVLYLPPLAWPGFFLMVLPLVSLAAVLIAHPRFEVTRQLTPTPVQAGQPLTVELSIVADRLSLAGTTLIQDPVPSAIGDAHQAMLPPQQRGQLTVASYQRHPRRRGRFVIPALRLQFVDLLGLAVRTSSSGADTPVIVTPMVLALTSAPHRAFGHQGDVPIPQTSLSGPDDVLVRDYRPRDDVRRVHWPSTARTGELMVRQEEQAWDPAAWIIVDSRRNAHPDGAHVSPTFEWLVTAAASVGVQLIDEGYDVSMVDADGAVFASRSLEHTRPRRAWLEHLVDADFSGNDRLGHATHQVSQSSSGHMIVALLGRLDRADARQLVYTYDTSQQCRAIVIAARSAVEVAEQQQAIQILIAHGWQVATTTVGSSLATTWASLAEHSVTGGRR